LLNGQGKKEKPNPRSWAGWGREDTRRAKGGPGGKGRSGVERLSKNRDFLLLSK